MLCARQCATQDISDVKAGEASNSSMIHLAQGEYTVAKIAELRLRNSKALGLGRKDFDLGRLLKRLAGSSLAQFPLTARSSSRTRTLVKHCETKRSATYNSRRCTSKASM